MKKDYFGLYDPTSPGHMGYNWRQVVWHPAEKAFYGVHGNSGYLFRFDPRGRRVEVLERLTSLPSQRSGMYDQFSYGYLGFTLAPTAARSTISPAARSTSTARRVAGKDSTGKGEAKGLEDLHLVTYDIPTAKYIDHGAIFLKDGQRPLYVNSIAVGKDGSVYTLCRITAGGHTRTDLIRIPAESIILIALQRRECVETNPDAKATHLDNPLAIRIMNYGKYQDDAWTHLPSLGMHYVFLATPAPDEVAALEKRLAEHHLRPLVLRGDTDLGRASSVDELAGQLAVCEKMGVKYMFLSPKHTGVSKEVACDRLRQAGDIARQHGVIIVLETHPDLGANADAHLETMRRINHPNVRVNFDTGNITYYNKGTDAVTELKKIIDYVATVEVEGPQRPVQGLEFPRARHGRGRFPRRPEGAGRAPLPRPDHHRGRGGPRGRNGRGPDEAVHRRVGEVHPVAGQFPLAGRRRVGQAKRSPTNTPKHAWWDCIESCPTLLFFLGGGIAAAGFRIEFVQRQVAVVDLQGECGEAGHHQPAAVLRPGVLAGWSEFQLPAAQPSLLCVSISSRRILRFQVSQSWPGWLCITCVA